MTVMDLREKAGCWSGCDGCGSCTVSADPVRDISELGMTPEQGIALRHKLSAFADGWDDAPDTTVQPREGDALPPEEDACACGCKVCSEAKVNP